MQTRAKQHIDRNEQFQDTDPGVQPYREPKMRYVGLSTVLCTCMFCARTEALEPDTTTLVRQVIESAGGEEKLLKRFRIDERFNAGAERQSPGKSRTSILEPPDYWWIGKKERGQEPGKVAAWAWTLGVLTDPDSQIEIIADVTESDVPLSGLRVTGTVEPELDMYFDKKTHELVRIDWRRDIYLFSEWKEFGGTRYPAKSVMLRRQTRKPWFHHEIVRVERIDELPTGLSRRPIK